MTERPFDEPVADEALAVNTRREANAVIVTVTGAVDLATMTELQEATHNALRQANGGTVVIDLSAVTFFGSSGLAVLVEAASSAEQRDEALRVVVDSNRPVIQPLEITGLAGVLALYDTVEEALTQPRAQDTERHV